MAAIPLSPSRLAFALAERLPRRNPVAFALARPRTDRRATSTLPTLPPDQKQPPTLVTSRTSWCPTSTRPAPLDLHLPPRPSNGPTAIPSAVLATPTANVQGPSNALFAMPLAHIPPRPPTLMNRSLPHRQQAHEAPSPTPTRRRSSSMTPIPSSPPQPVIIATTDPPTPPPFTLKHLPLGPRLPS